MCDSCKHMVNIDPQTIADMIREDRDERDEYLESIILESIKQNKDILDKLGSDYNEDGIAYWEKK
jgi:hypothetical protein